MPPSVLDPPRPSAAPVIDSEALTEVEYGETVEKPEMGIRSNWIAFRLALLLAAVVEKEKRGQVFMEALLILDREENLRRRPDVCFVSAERWPLDRPLPSEGDWEVVPDLAIEVISPNDPFEKVHAKLGEYFAHGVREVWVISPGQKQAHIYSSPTQSTVLTQDRTLQTTLLPGLEIALAGLFAGL